MSDARSGPTQGGWRLPSPGAGRILVVDDQPANIQVVGSILGKLGHEIIPASDGSTALKRLALRPPDLVLLDLLMPGMDGFEVCRRIREDRALEGLPVVFLSAADDKDLIVRALEAGGIDYITKPFNAAELVTRVQTQLGLKQARDRLRQLAEDKDELLGILAHDLKNNLGAMQISAQILARRMVERGDARSGELADMLLHSSSQLLAFVNQLLANSAADHAMVILCQPVRLGEVISGVVAQYDDAARRKRLRLGARLAEGPDQVLADPTALHQVLDNLVSNAVKFSPPGRSIEVSVHGGADGIVECRVRDEGPGFTPEDRVRLFQRYARLSARPTGGEPSTGLGLSIARKLAGAMRGELVCESAPGAGACFVLRLPRAPG